MSLDLDNRPPRQATEPGVHNAICIGVWDLGTHDVPPQFGGGTSHRLALAWVLENGSIETKEYSLNVYKNPKTGIKTALANDLEGWFFPASVFDEKGVSKVTKESLMKLAGKHCQLKTTLNDKGYCKVESVHPAAKKDWESPVKLSVYEVGQSDFPDEMPRWMKTKVSNCQELAGSSGQESQAQHPGTPSSGGAEIPF